MAISGIQFQPQTNNMAASFSLSGAQGQPGGHSPAQGLNANQSVGNVASSLSASASAAAGNGVAVATASAGSAVSSAAAGAVDRVQLSPPEKEGRGNPFNFNWASDHPQSVQAPQAAAPAPAGQTAQPPGQSVGQPQSAAGPQGGGNPIEQLLQLIMALLQKLGGGNDPGGGGPEGEGDGGPQEIKKKHKAHKAHKGG